MACNITSWESFPTGFRVLLVDDDRTCLRVIERMLQFCHYQVTCCNRARDALVLLQEKKEEFDLVLTDVRMPEMDGYQFLERIEGEIDIPVVLISAECEVQYAMKGLELGACFYLMKPVSVNELKNIWQYVIRRKSVLCRDNERVGSYEESERIKFSEISESSGSSTHREASRRLQKKKMAAENENHGKQSDEFISSKKTRLVWNPELHNKFLKALNQLQCDSKDAVPKKILRLMNVPGITRENVASHLQKYRLYLRKKEKQESTALHLPPCFSYFTKSPQLTSMAVSSRIPYSFQDQFHDPKNHPHLKPTIQYEFSENTSFASIYYEGQSSRTSYASYMNQYSSMKAIYSQRDRRSEYDYPFHTCKDRIHDPSSSYITYNFDVIPERREEIVDMTPEGLAGEPASKMTMKIPNLDSSQKAACGPLFPIHEFNDTSQGFTGIAGIATHTFNETGQEVHGVPLLDTRGSHETSQGTWGGPFLAIHGLKEPLLATPGFDETGQGSVGEPYFAIHGLNHTGQSSKTTRSLLPISQCDSHPIPMPFCINRAQPQEIAVSNEVDVFSSILKSPLSDSYVEEDYEKACRKEVSEEKEESELILE